jgi:hypothetical protein
VQLTNAVESQLKWVIGAYFDIAEEKRDFFESNLSEQFDRQLCGQDQDGVGDQ